MPLDENKVVAAFDKAAKHYDSASSWQQQMGEQLIQRIPPHHFYRLIDLGCGTGLTTQRLSKTIQYHHFEAVDLSSRMIEQAKANYLSSIVGLGKPSIHFKQQSFNELPEATYDLAFSNMALHWSPHFSTTLSTIAAALKKQGLFVFSIPISGTFDELRPLFNTHTFFSLEKVVEELIHAGFSLLYTTVQRDMLVFDNLRQALRMLKKTGATVCEKQDFSYPTIRRHLQRNPMQTLTYVVGLFIVKKR